MVQSMSALWIRCNNNFDVLNKDYDVKVVFYEVIVDQDNDQQGLYDFRVQRWYSTGRCHHGIPCGFWRDCSGFPNSCSRWCLL